MNEWNSRKRSALITAPLRKVVGASASLSPNGSCCSCRQYRAAWADSQDLQLSCTRHASSGASRPESCTDSAFQHQSLSRSAVQQPRPPPPPHPLISPPEDENGDIPAGLKSKAQSNRRALIFSLSDHFRDRRKHQSPQNSFKVHNGI